MHFAIPNLIAFDTKVRTNDDKNILHLIIDSSIAPQNLTPSAKPWYQIDDYVAVKYNNS